VPLPRSWLVAVAASLLWAGPTATAAAESGAARDGDAARLIEARVVALDDADLVLDVGRAHGLGPGDALVLWRPVTLRHPVTRRALTDRFIIGKVRLTQVQRVLSWARIEGEAARQPQPGDIVVGEATAPPRAVPTKPPDPPRPEAAAAQASVPTGDPDARAVAELFDGLAGATVVERIRSYEAYAEAHPGSRFARVLQEEALALRELVKLHARPGAAAAPSLSAGSYEPPVRALEGVPLSVGVDIEGGAAGAVLHSRHAGEVTYVTTPMTPAGPGYFVAILPAERLRAPRVELFIEATTERGRAVPVAGSPEQPHSIPVDRIPSPAPPPEHRARAALVTDYADYNRLRGNDRVWQTEGQLGLRFQDTGVRALRSGFGVYRGVGGSLEELDTLGLEPRSVGLTYGHLEGEIAFAPSWALIGRAVLGLGDDGVASGAQAHLRIGSDLDTNLTIGGEVLGGIGLRGITQLEFDPEGTVPVVLRSEVTNQPAGSRGREPAVPPGALAEQTVERSEVGIRIIAQAGYRVLPPLVLSLRGSYQGRTINHAGPGFGGGVTYSW
jgi:hypothetical protein